MGRFLPTQSLQCKFGLMSIKHSWGQRTFVNQRNTHKSLKTLACNNEACEGGNRPEDLLDFGQLPPVFPIPTVTTFPSYQSTVFPQWNLNLDWNHTETVQMYTSKQRLTFTSLFADTPLADRWRMQWFATKQGSERTTACGCLLRRRLRLSGPSPQPSEMLRRVVIQPLWSWQPNPPGCTSGNVTHSVTSQHFCFSCSLFCFGLQRREGPTGSAHVFLYDIVLNGRHLFSVHLKCGQLQSTWKEAGVMSLNIQPNYV